MLPPVDCRKEAQEGGTQLYKSSRTLPPRKRLCLTAPIPRFKVGESSTVAATRQPGLWAARTNDYGFVDMVDDATRRHVPREVGYGITDTWDEDLFAHLEAAQDSRARLSDRVDILLEDRQLWAAVQQFTMGFRHIELTLRHRIFASVAGDIDIDLGCLNFITTEPADSSSRSDSGTIGEIRALQARDQARTNPRRSSATTRAAATAAARPAAAVAAATPMTAAAVEKLIEARVFAALANHETFQNNTNGHGDRSHNSGTGNRGTTRSLRECTYKDFLNCHPLNFKGTEGVVVLAQWFEKMESVFHISNSAVENQVKFATCTFVRNTLTWWNSHMKVVTQDVAYAMDWKTLKKMMTLALMCGRMFPEESDEVEKYVGGLPDMIRGNMMSYRPQTMEEAIEFSNNQMDQKLITITEGKLSRRER
ncbi:hypothetical protein Tco_1556591 [Tanacetum coccineum]